MRSPRQYCFANLAEVEAVLLRSGLRGSSFKCEGLTPFWCGSFLCGPPSAGETCRLINAGPDEICPRHCFCDLAGDYARLLRSGRFVRYGLATGASRQERTNRSNGAQAVPRSRLRLSPSVVGPWLCGRPVSHKRGCACDDSSLALLEFPGCRPRHSSFFCSWATRFRRSPLPRGLPPRKAAQRPAPATMAGSRYPSPRPSPTACRTPKTTGAGCRPWAATRNFRPPDVLALADYVWALNQRKE